MGSEVFLEIDPAIALGLCDPATRPAAIARVRGLLAKSTRLCTFRGLLADCRYFHLPYVVAGYAHAESLVAACSSGVCVWRAPVLAPVKSFGANDVFFNPGDYWSHRTYAQTVRDLKRSSDLRLALLVHDLFAAERPDWSNPTFGSDIQRQLGILAPFVDCWLATSQYVRVSLEVHAHSLGLAPKVPHVLPLGQSRVGNQKRSDPAWRRELLVRLGIPDTYILFVGTIEPRKNLQALLDALRDLRASGLGNVPHCVLVGREGWKSSELRRRLNATNFENGSITWLRNISDAELGALYDGAQFSVLPSKAEGWGLPISESIAHGLPWIATGAGGTHEAGTRGGAYFDPLRPNSLADVLRQWIQNPQAVAQARAAIQAARLSAPTWDRTGEALLERLLG
jgi:hypothetical protein